MFFQTTVRLFTGTFKALFSNFENFLKICWAWFALMMLAQLVLGPGPQADPDTPMAAAPGDLLASLVFLALALLSSASISVAWHRCLLLNETPPTVNLRVGGRELAYAGRFLLLMLIAGALFVPLAFLTTAIIGAMDVSGGVFTVFVLSGVLILILLPLLARIALILPACALDEPLSVKEAFGSSAGLGGPMVLSGIAASLAVTLPLLALGWLVALGGGGMFSLVATLILSLAAQIAGTALQIGILTGGYYILRERQMAAGGAGGAPE